jgi:uncharacterized membrane protein
MAKSLKATSPIPPFLLVSIAMASLILFICSSVRHLLFQSGALDLGYFDQALYLLSQGEPPIVSFWGYHFLGGHADWILYPLSWLYRIVPSVYWLFAIQAISLAIGALPTWFLGVQAGLKQSQARAVVVVYLLYPLIFNLNLFDFHPEVMALPVILGAVWAARQGKIFWFCLAILFIFGCRGALSLTVAAMGFWLLVFEKKRWCGSFALLTGVAWFLIATQVIIPYFRPDGVESVWRYAFLGDSIFEIAKNVLLKPQVVLARLLTLPNLEYLLLLLSPVLWGLSLRHLAPLIPAIPQLFLNLLTDYQLQKDLLHQYSLPILPFLIVAVIASLAAGHTWLQRPRHIMLWSLVFFVALGKFGYFGSIYLDTLDTWQANREAIAQVEGKGGVLAVNHAIPHLTHRPLIHLAAEVLTPKELEAFDYVLLDTRHPGLGSSVEVVTALENQLQQMPEFRVRYAQDEVFLFERM